MTPAHIDLTNLDNFGNEVKAIPLHFAPERA